MVPHLPHPTVTAAKLRGSMTKPIIEQTFFLMRLLSLALIMTMFACGSDHGDPSDSASSANSLTDSLTDLHLYQLTGPVAAVHQQQFLPDPTAASPAKGEQWLDESGETYKALFDQTGHVLSLNTLYEQSTESTQYQYDAAHRKAQAVQTREQEQMRMTWTYEAGKEKMELRHQDGQLFMTEWLSWTAPREQWLQHEIRLPPGYEDTVSRIAVRLVFDAQWHKIKQEQFQNWDQNTLILREIQEINPEGFVATIRQEDAEGRPVLTRTFTYPQKDLYANWTERIEWKDDKPILFTIRQITYH